MRLKSTTELSEGQIAGALSICRPSVAKYWDGFLGQWIDLYEGISLTFDDFAEYYDTSIHSRPVYQRICAPLRNRTFYSLQEHSNKLFLPHKCAGRIMDVLYASPDRL